MIMYVVQVVARVLRAKDRTTASHIIMYVVQLPRAKDRTTASHIKIELLVKIELLLVTSCMWYKWYKRWLKRWLEY